MPQSQKSKVGSEFAVLGLLTFRPLTLRPRSVFFSTHFFLNSAGGAEAGASANFVEWRHSAPCLVSKLKHSIGEFRWSEMYIHATAS